MTAERDSMTLNEVSVPALGVEERSDEAPRAGRARPWLRRPGCRTSMVPASPAIFQTRSPRCWQWTKKRFRPEGKGVPIGASALTPADGAAPSAASPGLRLRCALARAVFPFTARSRDLCAAPSLERGEEAPDRGGDLRARGFGLGGCPAS